MSRLLRKKRKDIVFKGCGGITDAFDDVIKDMWRINDEEYDYLCENMTDEQMGLFLFENTDITSIKKAIAMVNEMLTKFPGNI